MVIHVFMSHTKLDKRFCDRFDNAVARVGIRAFRSEFETIEPPAWKTIKKQMELSSAMFLLVGRQLVKSQAASDKTVKSREEWKHTQNWIAYEVGLACEKGIDVWVLCDACMHRNGGGIFVTKDKNFHKKTKKPRLIALGAGEILKPPEVVDKINQLL